MTDARERLIDEVSYFLGAHVDYSAIERHKTAEELIAAIEAAGVRLVPSEATEEMSLAAEDILALSKRGGAVSQTLVSPAAGIWDSMLAASPYAPSDSP